MSDLIGHLHRTATKHGMSGNWALGAAYLKEAQLLLIKETVTQYPIQTWLRLPKFLQKAGESDAAIAECEFLINNIKEIRKTICPTESDLWRSRSLHLSRSKIYDQMRMICAVEKRNEQAKQFLELAMQEQVFMEKKDDLIESLSKKAKKGDQKACALLGHEWRIDRKSKGWLGEICAMCKTTRQNSSFDSVK